MSSNMWLKIMTTFAAGVVLTSAAAAMPIMDLNQDVNGSFEVGFVTTPDNGGLLPNVLAGAASPAFDFGTGAGIVADGTAGPPAAASLLLDSPGDEDQVPYDGANSAYILVSGGPGQAQVFGGIFDVTPGEDYTIDWFISRAPNRFSAQSQLRIYDNAPGGLAPYLFSGLFTQDDVIAPVWEPKSLTFTAPASGSVLVQFYAQNREGATPESVTLFDGITVVPEPASLLLLGLAAALLRRR